MVNNLTTDDFIRRAKYLPNYDRYDYSLVNYEGSSKKVTIICKEHGSFLQAPKHHLSGHGCQLCGNATISKYRKSNTNDFIKKAIELYGEGAYDYSKVDYKNAQSKIIIICPIHGEFEQSPNNHLHNFGCRKCGDVSIGNKLRGNTDEFIKKAVEIHGAKYDYSLINYIDTKKKVIIICPIHGEFQQAPYSHLLGSGCNKCGSSAVGDKLRHNIDDFIIAAKRVHKDKYDYSLVDYTGRTNKVTIVCPIHGEFEQTPYGHLSGKGCSKCAWEKYGWEPIKWGKAGNTSRYFDGFKVYIMEFKDDNQQKFYKIGKTFRPIKKRTANLKPYIPTNIMTIKGTSKFCSKLEIMMHRALKEYRYKPQIKFAGSTECFSHIPDDIFNTLKSFSNA